MTAIHISLPTTDLDRAITFYRDLFATEPDKVRPGYARFVAIDGALRLSLNHVSGDIGRHQREAAATHRLTVETGDK